jgi:hypothetical protein
MGTPSTSSRLTGGASNGLSSKATWTGSPRRISSIASLDLRPRPRAPLLDRHHVGDPPLLEQGQPRVAPADRARLAEAGERRGGDVEREGIERVGGAVERGRHQGIHLGLVDVGLADQAQRLAEHREVFVKGIVVGLGVGLVGGAHQGGREQGEDDDCGDEKEDETTAVHDSSFTGCAEPALP